MNVLLTGATGYVGRRLQERLASDPGVRLRLLVRNALKVQTGTRENIEVIEGSTFDAASLRAGVRGIEAAYYLIHSMGAGRDFPQLERTSALNFRDACVEAGVKRIIYLGGLGTKQTASEHLLSRIETGELLSARPESIQTLWFRAGVIVGSGSASFEIIRNLVQKIPIMVTPRWVMNRTQPVAISDVLDYLGNALTLNAGGNLIIDIGGEPKSFREMILEAAEVMGLKRRVITFPFFTPRLSSYWLLILSPVPYSIARALVDGLKSETLVENDKAREYFPGIRPMPYRKAVIGAIEEITRNQVLSRWCDSSAKKACDIQGPEKTAEAVYTDRHRYDLGDVQSEKVFESFSSLGGDQGWFRYNWLWRLRGFLDKLAGGPGLNRGRRDPHELRIGDSLDFWKVQDVKENKRLLLLSQMRLPGRAWLEFSIQGRTFVQTAYFLPKGLSGRLYWYSMKLPHLLIFPNLAKNILRRARRQTSMESP